MIRTIIAVLVALVLCADFLFAVGRKKLNMAELVARAFMIVAYAYLAQAF